MRLYFFCITLLSLISYNSISQDNDQHKFYLGFKSQFPPLKKGIYSHKKLSGIVLDNFPFNRKKMDRIVFNPSSNGEHNYYPLGITKSGKYEILFILKVDKGTLDKISIHTLEELRMVNKGNENLNIFIDVEKSIELKESEYLRWRVIK